VNPRCPEIALSAGVSVSNFSYFSTLVGSGQYSLKIVAIDLLGNEESQSVTVTEAN